MLKYFFGVGDDDSRPLVDEPTIDYNDTIHSTTRSTPPRKSILKDNTATGTTSRLYNTHIPELGDYSDSELDYDDELINDVNIVREITQSTTGFEGRFGADNYPGKYPHSRDGTHEVRYEDEGKRERNIYPTEPIYESTIDRKLNQLQIEVDNEIYKYRNSKEDPSDTSSQLHDINQRLKARSQYLNKLSQLAAVYNEEEKSLIPGDIMEKYEDLKTDYLQELKTTQTLYLVYYRLLEKHLQYRKGKTVKKESSKSVLPIREKIKHIQSKTSEQSIKNICGNILSDVNKWEQERDQLLEEKQKLQEDLLKMKTEKEQLELELKKGSS
ncbi:hypothetical protein JA1_002734 [Spathaspora sp. JA1]|nr:hypothetical protein JA1_002734 [Spathaspora sp. JA1]